MASEIVIVETPQELELLRLMQSMSTSERRKLLTLGQRVVSGEFDIMQTLGWTDQQRHDFMQSLPEAVMP